MSQIYDSAGLKKQGPFTTATAVGSISAGTTSASLGQVVFSNSNNVTFGMNGATVTASAAGGGAGTMNVSAGTTSNNLDTVVFSNSNGVSFGLNGSTITGSVATSLTNVRVSAGTTSNLLSAITFSNSNGVSFGLNASTLTASVATSLTNINVSAGTTSNNLSAITFSNSNNFSFGLNGSVVTASYTVPTVTNSTMTFQDSATTVSNTKLVFGSANGLTLAMSTAAGVATVTGSYTVPSTAGLISAINVSAGTTSNNLSKFTVADSNGVSFGLNGSTLTATVKTDYLTTARASTDAIGLNTAKTNVTWTVNSSGLSLDAGGYAGTGTSATNASITLNSNGLAISVAAGGGNALTLQDAATTLAVTKLIVSNANNVTMGLNTAASIATLTASVAAQSVESQSLGMSNLGNTAGTTGIASGGQVRMLFAGGNNVTLSQSLNGASGTITMSVGNYITTARASTDAIGLNTAKTNVTWTVNSSGLSFDAGGYAGTATAATNATLTVNSNGVSVNAGGATVPYWEAVNIIHSIFSLNIQNSSIYAMPVVIPYNVTMDCARQALSWVINSGTASTQTSAATRQFTAQQVWTHRIALFSRLLSDSSLSIANYMSTTVGMTHEVDATVAANGSQFSSVYAISYPLETTTSQYISSISASEASQRIFSSHLVFFGGIKWLDFPWATSVSPGQYWVIANMSSTQNQTTAGGDVQVKSVFSFGRSYVGVRMETSGSNMSWAAYGDSVQCVKEASGFGNWTTDSNGTWTTQMALSDIATRASCIFNQVVLRKISS